MFTIAAFVPSTNRSRGAECNFTFRTGSPSRAVDQAVSIGCRVRQIECSLANRALHRRLHKMPGRRVLGCGHGQFQRDTGAYRQIKSTGGFPMRRWHGSAVRNVEPASGEWTGRPITGNAFPMGLTLMDRYDHRKDTGDSRNPWNTRAARWV